MRTRPRFSDMLALAPHYNHAKPDHKANDSGKRIGSIGRLYLDMLESGRPPEWVAQEIHTIAYRRAYRTTTRKGDTLNREYAGQDAVVFATDVADDVLIRCLSGTPDKVAKVTVRSAIGRVDRSNNKATRYWECLYLVRFNFTTMPAPSPNPGEMLTIPCVGEWRWVVQTQYKQARKIESPEHAPYRWVECMEYRKTVRTLTDADHEDDGYTTKMGDMQVWSVIRGHLTKDEQTALHLYGMGMRSPVIARALYGNDTQPGDAARARKFIAQTLTKLSNLCNQQEEPERAANVI